MSTIQVGTEAEDSIQLKLSHCILIWGLRKSDRFAYARLHSVQKGDAGTWQVSEAGIPLSADGLNRVLSRFESAQAQALPVRPERVLHESRDRCAWWRPAAPATVFFKTKELGGDVSGQVPLPPLLWLRAKDRLAVAALGSNRRPLASDRVFIAPFFNIFQSGEVCAGSVAFQSIPFGPAGIEATERAFFGSNFTHPNHRKEHTTHPRGVYALWKDLLFARPALTRFPRRWLAPSDGSHHAASVGEFILETKKT